MAVSSELQKGREALSQCCYSDVGPSLTEVISGRCGETLSWWLLASHPHVHKGSMASEEPRTWPLVGRLRDSKLGLGLHSILNSHTQDSLWPLFKMDRANHSKPSVFRRSPGTAEYISDYLFSAERAALCCHRDSFRVIQGSFSAHTCLGVCIDCTTLPRNMLPHYHYSKADSLDERPLALPTRIRALIKHLTDLEHSQYPPPSG